MIATMKLTLVAWSPLTDFFLDFVHKTSVNSTLVCYLSEPLSLLALSEIQATLPEEHHKSWLMSRARVSSLLHAASSAIWTQTMFYSSIRLTAPVLNSQLLKVLVKPSQILVYSKEVEEWSLKYGNWYSFNVSLKKSSKSNQIVDEAKRWDTIH